MQKGEIPRPPLAFRQRKLLPNVLVSQKDWLPNHPTCQATNMRSLFLLCATWQGVLSFQHLYLPGRLSLNRRVLANTALFADNNNNNDDDDAPASDGADLAAEFAKMAQTRGINIDRPNDDDNGDDEYGYLPEDDIDENYDLLDDDLAEDDDEGLQDLDELSTIAEDNELLSDERLSNEVKERLLDTAGGFVRYVSDQQVDGHLEYENPTTIPDPALTAAEVVLLVLEALAHNDEPYENRGIEVLQGFASPMSALADPTLLPAEYKQFLLDDDCTFLLQPHEPAIIEKHRESGERTYITALVIPAGQRPLDAVSVNFVLHYASPCWLIDSFLIRPPSMRRRR